VRPIHRIGVILHFIIFALLGLGGGLGCGIDKSALAEGAANPGTQTVPPALPRMQSADPEPARKPVKGNILDLASYETSGPSDSQPAARIRATVNGVAILDDEVRQPILRLLHATSSLPEPERSARRGEILKQALDRVVDRELVLQDLHARLKDRPQIMDKLKEAAEKDFDKRMRDAKKQQNLKSDDEFKDVMRAEGWTMENLRRHLTRDFMKEEYMKMQIFSAIDRVGHEQIQEYYEKHPEEFRILDSVTWQDIFIDAGKFPNRDAARQFATNLMNKARAGEDFTQLVSKYDQGDSSYRNGEGIGHRKGEIKPLEAEPILFQMREGEVGPVIDLTNGFHVIRLTQREYAGLKPFDEKTQTAIRNKLQQVVFEKEYKRIIANLRRNATIEIATASP
jgi:parvulin-like peptidyl-prolyl isomerase